MNLILFETWFKDTHYIFTGIEPGSNIWVWGHANSAVLISDWPSEEI